MVGNSADVSHAKLIRPVDLVRRTGGEAYIVTDGASGGYIQA